MAMQNNWFDDKYTKALKDADAKAALKVIAEDVRVLGAVQEAIDEFDKHDKEPGWGGPTRTQAIRTAVNVALNEQEID